MDKELTIQDLEAQADALLAAADEMEELLPADTGKSKRKKAEDEAPEKKAPPLDEATDNLKISALGILTNFGYNELSPMMSTLGNCRGSM